MELKIQPINFSPNFNINKILAKPYLVPLGYDTVSFCKKPTPREMLFGIQNRLSSEELNRYRQFTNERKSK